MRTTGSAEASFLTPASRLLPTLRPEVAEKNHAHSTLNPLAQYQRRYSLTEIMAAEMLAYPNNLPMCCPTGDGAAAVVLVSETKLRTLGERDRPRLGVRCARPGAIRELIGDRVRSMAVVTSGTQRFPAVASR